MAKRILHEIELDKIAGVTLPCQEHATVAIIKRSYTENERTSMAEKGEAMSDGSFPIKDKADLTNAIQAHGRAKAKAKAKRHIIRRAKAIGETDSLPSGWNLGTSSDADDSDMGKSIAKLASTDVPAARGFAELLAANEAQQESWDAQAKMWPLFDALRDSLGSIASDPALDAQAKVSQAEQSVNEFVVALKSEWPDVAEEVEKIAKASPDADAMSAFIKAGLAGNSAKENNMADVKEADLTKAAETLESDHPIVKSLIEKAKAKGKEEAAADWMDGEGKPTKKAAELVAKHAPADADEILKVGDTTIKKSVVGEAHFAMFKAQNDQLVKARDESENAKMAKRAADEFPSLVGTDVEKGAILRHLSTAPEPVLKSAEAILKAAEDMAKGSFETRGSGGGDRQPGGGAPIAKAKEDFMGKVSEIQTRDSVSKAKAMEKAEREHPALFKAYREADAA